MNRTYRLWTLPVYPTFIQTQRAKFLHYSLIASTLAGPLIAIPNLSAGAYLVTGILLALAIYGVVGIRLNQDGRYEVAAWSFVILVVAAIEANLIDGAGLHDPAIAALPLLVLMFAVLFDRNLIFLGAALGVASILAVYFLHTLRLHEYSYPPTAERVVIIGILITITAMVLWLFAGSWEQTLDFLRESYDRTLEGWVKALEYKDPATSGHVQEVVELTTRLAENMGCSAEEIQHIRRGALLHDIGKLGIPDRILAKSGPLSDDEWKIMREHPSLAREFLSGIPFLAAAINIPYSHHEHWNGDGYPQGLRGDEIPLAARIFAVVDVWHALNEDRPYRPAWTRPEIVAYLRSNAGTLFDPDVVRCFLEIVE